MESSLPQAGTEVADLLLKCHQLEKELASSADLSVDQFHCLSQLHMHAPCCVKELCELLGIHPTRASRLLHDLERRGYLARSLGFSDKRKEQVNLTPDGVAVVRSLLQSSALSVKQLAAVLPEEALKHLTSSADSGERETESI
jgi:DNA-binding MarR family transcriptional regulator